MNNDRIKRKLWESKQKLKPKAITSFQGQYRFLSNFWTAEIEYEGLKFRSVEHAYVAAKTTDIPLRKEIQNIYSPGDVKRFGRKLQLRPDWETIKLGVMEYLVYQKFSNHPELRSKLLATGKRDLIESNYWHDQIWGNCLCNNHKDVEGQNLLGKILMKIREDLI